MQLNAEKKSWWFEVEWCCMQFVHSCQNSSQCFCFRAAQRGITDAKPTFDKISWLGLPGLNNLFYVSKTSLNCSLLQRLPKLLLCLATQDCCCCTRLSAVSCLFTCLLVSDNWMSGARRAEAIIIGDCATLATILAALCSWPSWHHSRDTWQHRPVVTMGVQAEAPPSQRERRSSPQVQGHQQCWIQGHQQCRVSLLYVV